MRKVKLFAVYDKILDGSDYYNQLQILSGSTSDWEEVSDEDYELIYKHKWNLDRVNKCQYILIEDTSALIQDKIKSIKDLLKQQEMDRLKQDVELKKKEKERKVKAEKMKIEKAKKLLEEKGLLK